MSSRATSVVEVPALPPRVMHRGETLNAFADLPPSLPAVRPHLVFRRSPGPAPSHSRFSAARPRPHTKCRSGIDHPTPERTCSRGRAGGRAHGGPREARWGWGRAAAYPRCWCGGRCRSRTSSGATVSPLANSCCCSRERSESLFAPASGRRPRAGGLPRSKSVKPRSPSRRSRGFREIRDSLRDD